MEKAFDNQPSYNKTIFDRKASVRMRSMMISSLRNNKIAATLDRYLQLMSDKSEDLKVRWAMLDALAWYDLSARKADIAAAAKAIMDDVNEDASLREKPREHIID